MRHIVYLPFTYSMTLGIAVTIIHMFPGDVQYDIFHYIYYLRRQYFFDTWLYNEALRWLCHAALPHRRHPHCAELPQLCFFGQTFWDDCPLKNEKSFDIIVGG